MLTQDYAHAACAWRRRGEKLTRPFDPHLADGKFVLLLCRHRRTLEAFGKNCSPTRKNHIAARRRLIPGTASYELWRPCGLNFSRLRYRMIRVRDDELYAIASGSTEQRRAQAVHAKPASNQKPLKFGPFWPQMVKLKRFGLDMHTLSAKDAKYNFGWLIATAWAVVVVLAVEEYERLKAIESEQSAKASRSGEMK